MFEPTKGAQELHAADRQVLEAGFWAGMKGRNRLGCCELAGLCEARTFPASAWLATAIFAALAAKMDVWRSTCPRTACRLKLLLRSRPVATCLCTGHKLWARNEAFPDPLGAGN